MAASWLTSKVGGAFHKGEAPTKDLTHGAAQLIEQAFDGFDVVSPVVDYRAHLYGKGTNSGCILHPDTFNKWRHPVRAMKLKLVESGAGIDNEKKWDTQYVERLLSLIDGVSPKSWGRTHLLSVDYYVEKSTELALNKTGIYVPNDYLMDVVNKHPKEFVGCVSVHPYRKNALDLLRKWAASGVKMVSWIPTSMNIDPSSSQCIEYYRTLAANEMTLLVQCGPANAFESPVPDESLGNPLFLRNALNHGVKVIVANCGGDGKSLDIDKPFPHPMEENVLLFLRLMEEPQYEGLLFGDISGITAFGRIDCLVNVLDRSDIHRRLVYGSDYPMPAINLVVQTYWHANRGLLTEDQSGWLGEIYKFNPIIFDFVLKRTLRSPKTGNHFDIRIFKEHPGLMSGVRPSTLPSSSRNTTTTSSKGNTNSTTTNSNINNTYTTDSSSNNNNKNNNNESETKKRGVEESSAYVFSNSKNDPVVDEASEGTPIISSSSELSASEPNLEDINDNDNDDNNNNNTDDIASSTDLLTSSIDLLKDFPSDTTTATTTTRNTFFSSGGVGGGGAFINSDGEEELEEEVCLDD